MSLAPQSSTASASERGFALKFKVGRQQDLSESIQLEDERTLASELSWNQDCIEFRQLL